MGNLLHGRVKARGQVPGSRTEACHMAMPFLKVMVMAHTPIVNRQTQLSFSARHAGMQAAGVWGCSCNKLVSGGAAGRLLVSGGGTGWQKSPSWFHSSRLKWEAHLISEEL